MNLAIHTENLGKRYRLGETFAKRNDLREHIVSLPRRIIGRKNTDDSQYIWALKNINISIKEGEVVGIIGRNGAGKSTFLKVLSRITLPTEGMAKLRGRVGSLLEVGTGFNPELTGRENIYLNAAIIGMKKNEVEQKFDQIVEFSGVERFLDTPIKRYSSGMIVRLGFSVAAHLDPDILIVDEVLAVGDHEFQKKCIGKMRDVSGSGRTVLMVSHNMQSIRNLCPRTILIDGGKVDFDGNTNDAIKKYVTKSVTISDYYDLINATREKQAARDLKFKSIKFNKKEYLPSDKFEIKLNFEAVKKFPAIDIGIDIVDEYNNEIYHLANKFVAHSLAEYDPGDEFVFTIPKLRLKPGKYYMRLFVSSRGIIQDWIFNQCGFEVAEGNVYGWASSKDIFGLTQPEFYFEKRQK